MSRVTKSAFSLGQGDRFFETALIQRLDRQIGGSISGTSWPMDKRPRSCKFGRPSKHEDTIYDHIGVFHFADTFIVDFVAKGFEKPQFFSIRA